MKKIEFFALALILAGAPGFGYEEIMHRVKESECRNDIFLLGYVSEERKYLLYQHAAAFIFLPLYEGFGLPLLEAQYFGIPVIASNLSSLPEIAGEGALLIDPHDVRLVAASIANVISDKKMRGYMVKKGYENLKRFSWEKSAKETLDILLTV